MIKEISLIAAFSAVVFSLVYVPPLLTCVCTLAIGLLRDVY